MRYVSHPGRQTDASADFNRMQYPLTIVQQPSGVMLRFCKMMSPEVAKMVEDVRNDPEVSGPSER